MHTPKSSSTECSAPHIKPSPLAGIQLINNNPLVAYQPNITSGNTAFPASRNESEEEEQGALDLYKFASSHGKSHQLDGAGSVIVNWPYYEAEHSTGHRFPNKRVSLSRATATSKNLSPLALRFFYRLASSSLLSSLGGSLSVTQIRNATWSSTNVWVTVDMEHQFSILKDSLVNSSVYFKSIFGDGKTWLESSSGHVKLEGVSPAMFGMFALWATTGKLDNTKEIILFYGKHKAKQMKDADFAYYYKGSCYGVMGMANTGGIAMHEIDIALELLIDSYILGDYLGAARFENAIIDEIIKRYEQAAVKKGHFPLHNLHSLYNNTYSTSELRALVVDIVRCRFSQTMIEEGIKWGVIPDEMVLQIEARREDGAGCYPGSLPPWKLPACRYHEHGKKEVITCEPAWAMWDTWVEPEIDGEW